MVDRFTEDFPVNPVEGSPGVPDILFAPVVTDGPVAIVKLEDLLLLALSKAVLPGQPDGDIVKAIDARSENLRFIGNGVEMVEVDV